MATILIVDDDDAIRDGLAETVTDLGYRAHLAASGSDALALVAAGGIDAVLLDLRMPGGLDGIEVLRRIRRARTRRRSRCSPPSPAQTIPSKPCGPALSIISRNRSGVTALRRSCIACSLKQVTRQL